MTDAGAEVILNQDSIKEGHWREGKNSPQQRLGRADATHSSTHAPRTFDVAPAPAPL